MKPSSHSIPLFDSIEQYNFRINISPPRYTDFDIRSFEDNMKTVKLKMSPFRIPFFQLALLESGGGTVSSDGKAHDLDNFTLFFTVPGQIIYWDVPQDWRGFYVCIEESFYSMPVDGYQRLYDFPFFKNFTPAIKLQREEAKMILDIMDKIHEEYTHPTPYNKSIVKSYLTTILAYSIQFYERESEEKEAQAVKSSLGGRFKELVHKSISAMVLNIEGQDLSVSACADQLFVTTKHLSETIKAELGVTPTDYINDQLIAESQKLLLSTDLQVKEIAYQLGFQGSSYFNRLFKKITGITPAGYRKSQNF